MKKVLIVLSALVTLNVFAQVDATENTVTNSRVIRNLDVKNICYHYRKVENRRGERVWAKYQSPCNSLSEISCLGKQAAALQSVLLSNPGFILDYRINQVELVITSPSFKQTKKLYVYDDPILRIEVPYAWGGAKCDILSAEEIQQSINEIYRYN